MAPADWQAKIISRQEPAIRPAKRAKPAKQHQIALPVAAKTGYGVIRQTVLGRVSGEASLMEPRQAVVFPSGPQIALCVFKERRKPVGDNAG